MKYPIYIPSKGRANKCKTANMLLAQGIKNFFIVVEKDEYKDYCKNFDPKYILMLPKSNYGSVVPAKNLAMEHSIKNGFKYHWQLDDDISRVFEHKLGKKVHNDTNKIFTYIESLIKKYPNVKLFGIKTSTSFLSQGGPEITHNTSLTCLMLVANMDLRFKFIPMGGDIDYQLQILRKGYDILRLNNFAFDYPSPMKNAGGYTDIYKDDEKRINALNIFLKNNPEIEPGFVRSSVGFIKLKNLGKVWRKFKRKNNIYEKNN
jgi:hypothetical protein